MNSTPQVLPVRKQDGVILSVLRKRLETILPVAMRAADIDMWLIICQEDDYDPIFKTLVPMSAWAPILQMLIFFDRGPQDGIERINLSMTDTLDLYHRPWSGTRFEQQWALLGQIIQERDPQRIGINTGRINWAAGGLTHNLYNQLIGAIPEACVGRLVSAEQVRSP